MVGNAWVGVVGEWGVRSLRGPRSDPWTITTEGSVDNPPTSLVAKRMLAHSHQRLWRRCERILMPAS
ncbi:uncharacterized protein METZ01_LOCUS465264, partial [marine metagenome]